MNLNKNIYIYYLVFIFKIYKKNNSLVIIYYYIEIPFENIYSSNSGVSLLFLTVDSGRGRGSTPLTTC